MRVLTHLPVQALRKVAEAFPDAEFIFIPQEGELPPEAHGEILLTFAWGGPNMAQVVERDVRWIHTIGTGVDRFPMRDVGDRILTCARGASAVPIAEWVVAMLLAFEKRLPQSWASSPPEKWNQAQLGGLAGKTVGLVGLGAIALAVADRLSPFGVRLIASRRTDRPSPRPDVEVVSFEGLLERSDHLVVAAPATANTKHLIGEDALGRVKPGAHLVNIARGDLVDQDALRTALDDGRVAGASLDVCTPEPLPEGHWLYTHPNVRLSPHISWSSPGAIPVLFETFHRNLERWVKAEPLEGLVNLDEGY